MNYKIKEVADMVGISVRMLHHYDRIGLLKPESVSPAGYRLYTDRDLEVLQQVLFFKELEFSLQEIKEIIHSPNFDRLHALKAQEDLLARKKERLEKIIEMVRKASQSVQPAQSAQSAQSAQPVNGGIIMSKNDKKEMFEAFDMSDIEKHQQQYAEEARQKYGHTDAYKESQRRTSRYTKEDWAAITARGNEIYAKIASLMDKDPSDAEVQMAVGEWRQHITDSFYNCTPEIFRGLGDLYVQDERFTANIDKVKPGLAAYLREAMHLYCDNLEK